MKIAVKSVISIVLVMGLVFQTGCLSYMAMEHGKRQIALKRAFIKNDQNAIRAIQLGDNGVGVGIDVSNLQALMENPLLQLGAALGDAAMIYAGYKGVDSLNSSESEDKTPSSTITGDRNNVTIVSGSGNTTHTESENNASGEGSSNAADTQAGGGTTTGNGGDIIPKP